MLMRSPSFDSGTHLARVTWHYISTPLPSSIRTLLTTPDMVLVKVLSDLIGPDMSTWSGLTSSSGHIRFLAFFRQCISDTDPKLDISPSIGHITSNIAYPRSQGNHGHVLVTLLCPNSSLFPCYWLDILLLYNKTVYDCKSGASLSQSILIWIL